MNDRTRAAVKGCLLASILVLWSAARAEVSVAPSAGSGVLTLQIVWSVPTDPVPQRVWRVVRVIPSVYALNANGDVRGDGPPDLASRPGSGWPVVAWAYMNGAAHDIAFSEWTGGEWSPVQLLSSGLEEELDPRLFLSSDGTIHVTWWTPGSPDQVWMRSRPAGSAVWGAPVLVTTALESGRHPSVAVVDGVLLVSYERPGSGQSQEVVVARRNPDGSFSRDVVAGTDRTDPLVSILHVHGTRLWADWAQDAQYFACSEDQATAGWAPPATVPCEDGSWVGVESLRRAIARQILAAP